MAFQVTKYVFVVAFNLDLMMMQKKILESIEEYRTRWISEGANWFSSLKPIKLNWDLSVQ